MDSVFVVSQSRKWQTSLRSWRLRVCLAGAFTILLTVPVAAQQVPLTPKVLIGDAVENPDQYNDISEAITRFNNRDVLSARQFLDNALRQNPKLPPSGVTLAKMYYLTGNAPLGRASLEETVDEYPNDPEVYLILAEQAFANRQTIEADALFDKAIGLIDQFGDNAKRKRNFIIRAHAGRAAINERREKWQDSLEDLKKWVEVDPDNANAHNRLGRGLFMVDQPQQGFDEFKKAYDLDKNLPHPYVTTALMYETKGDNAKAAQAFERALQTNPKDEQTLLSYSQSLIRDGNLEKADQLLATARQEFPNSLDALLLSGVSAKMAKKNKPSEDYLIQALGISPVNHNVLNQLALLLISQPDDEKRARALQFARVDAQINSTSAEANITLAWVLYQLGQTADANQALQAGIRLGNRNADSTYLLAKMLVDQERSADAKKLLEQAMKLDERGIFIHKKEAEELLQSLNRE
jgi:type IV pilus assembly protein PilF